MIGPALAGKPVLGGWLTSPLQKFLQRGLAVRVRDALATLFERLLEKQPLEHFSSRRKPGIQVNRGDYGFERVGEEGRLFPAAGLFFATAKPQMLAKPDAPSRDFERLRIDDACACSSKAALRSTREMSREDIPVPAIRERRRPRNSSLSLSRGHRLSGF